MRDLTAKLRALIKTDVRRPVYEAELPVPATDASALAEILGGRLHGPSCITVDRVWEAYDWHGRVRVESCAIDAAAPLALFDPRAATGADWASRVVFFDLETTGLSGGAGTLAFLAGCGWFEDDSFKVRQFLLSGPAGEHAMLDALTEIFESASLLVTFNGRAFDLPLMETRWAFHRRDCPTGDLPHFDMLPPARRLWRWREDDGDCSLSAIERAVLRFHRVGDVPGFEIPSRYFRFLRTGDAEVIRGVLEHNRHDLISLAAVMAHALRLAEDGPDACETAGEQLALGRLYERAGDRPRALHAYERASESDDFDLGNQALARLALALRREARYDEAAVAWRRILERTPAGGSLGVFERRAAEALAIHHEHRARDLTSAKSYAQSLRAAIATGRLADQTDHRLDRLDRKMRVEKTRGARDADGQVPLEGILT